MTAKYLLRPISTYLHCVRHNTVQIPLATKENKTCRKIKTKMSGWQVHSYGEIDELTYCDKIKIPAIKSTSECLVKVSATTVNPIDVLMLSGYGAEVLKMLRGQPHMIEFPLTLGREFCGELVQCGMGVDKAQLSLGDRVWGVIPVHGNGAHAEYVAVPNYCISKAPENLSNAEAASVLYAGLTAWSGLYITGLLGGTCGALTSSGGRGTNKRVLVLGGSGSVGSLAIQILKSQGIQVITTCSEDAVENLCGIGADCVVDYKNPEEMKLLAQYSPYDIILDCAGQGPSYAETINYTFHQYITFSSPLLRNIDNSGIALGLIKNITNLIETNVKSLSQKHGLIKWGFFTPAPHGIQFLKQLVERKRLLPLIDSTYDFDKLPDAFRKVHSGHLRGKVVVHCN